MMLGIKPRALHMHGRYSASELKPSPEYVIYVRYLAYYEIEK
jgi:hypothetical protein